MFEGDLEHIDTFMTASDFSPREQLDFEVLPYLLSAITSPIVNT